MLTAPESLSKYFLLLSLEFFKLNKNGLQVCQLLLICSLSFGLFETMVISNARNNPCPLSHLSNHFDIHSIFNLCFTLSTDLFLNWCKANKLLTLLTFLFLPFSDNHFRGFKFKKFFGIRNIIISESPWKFHVTQKSKKFEYPSY